MNWGAMTTSLTSSSTCPVPSRVNRRCGRGRETTSTAVGGCGAVAASARDREAPLRSACSRSGAGRCRGTSQPERRHYRGAARRRRPREPAAVGNDHLGLLIVGLLDGQRQQRKRVGSRTGNRVPQRRHRDRGGRPERLHGCRKGDGDPSPEVDRLMKVLTDHTDPDGSHTGDQMSMGGSAGAAGPDGSAGQTTSIFAGTDWTVGERAGSVSLSVEDPTGGVSVGQPCGDEPMAEGPKVTYETLSLADGTTVLVGHGQRNGAERIAVRYETARRDGRG